MLSEEQKRRIESLYNEYYELSHTECVVKKSIPQSLGQFILISI